MNEFKTRPAKTSDADAIAAIYAPVVRDTAISFEETPPDGIEFAKRIREITKTHPWLVAVDQKGNVAGYAYASPHRVRAAYRWSVEVAVYLRSDHKRKGLGKALYTNLIALLKDQGFARAYAGITLPNDASVGFHEAMGFKKIGIYEGVGFKNNKWLDVGWWDLRLQEPNYIPT